MTNNPAESRTMSAETWRAIDVSGPSNVAWQIWEGPRMVAITFSKADADAIIADRAEAAALDDAEQRAYEVSCNADRYLSERDALQAALVDALKALQQYGEHEAGCHVRYWPESGVSDAGKCDCGLDAAIAQAEAQQGAQA